MLFRFDSPQGSFTLERYPHTGNPSFQPWDAGDLLLLKELSSTPIGPGSRVLVMNDSFGALTCALSFLKPDYYNDSYLAQKALARNLETNGIQSCNVRILNMDELIQGTGKYDLVMGKIPKHLSYLEMILQVLLIRTHPQSRIMLGGMTRHISRGVYHVCTKVFGSYTTSLAAKKARLIFLSPEQKTEVPDHPLSPADWINTEQWNGYTLVKLPNTFAQRGIDRGSRVLVSCLPHRTGPLSVLDLGCGNGFLSLAAALEYPEARIRGIDESALAVRSAELTFTRSMPDRDAKFTLMDGGSLEFQERFDLILCNPPFHEQAAVNRKLALGMILEAKKVLAADGHILVVANTSLGYQGVLAQYFPNMTVLARERGFSVFDLSS